LLAFNVLNITPDTRYTNIWNDPHRSFEEQQWDPVSIHARWDSFWYLNIAKHGYRIGQGWFSNVVFFPLYPLLILMTSFCVGGNFVLAGWILNLIFLFLALIYLVKLVREFHSGINPHLSILFLLIFPTAFFLNAVYTESIFFFLSIATFYYALKKNFLLAGVFGFFASLTRLTGLFLFIPLIWEYFKTYGFCRPFNLKLLAIFLIPAGILSFFLYHYLKFGDFFLFLRLQSRWGRTFFGVAQDHLSLLTQPTKLHLFLYWDALSVILALVVTIFVFKRLRTSYGLYMLFTILIALSTGTFISMGRFTLLFFPLYILIASIKNKYLQLSWGLLSILLLGLNITFFVHYYWAG
jgi:hypothetical protein